MLIMEFESWKRLTYSYLHQMKINLISLERPEKHGGGYGGV